MDDRGERDADEDPEEEDVRVEEVGYAKDVDGQVLDGEDEGCELEAEICQLRPLRDLN